MKKFLLSIFAVLFAFAGAQAQELVYTLEPATGSNNAYASNCDITIDGITWNLTGNSTMIPWRIGGKNLTNVDRALYSKTAMESAVSKVVLTTGTYNLSAVNSAKLLVANNADFDSAVEYSFDFAASSDIEIPVSAAAGSYYKFVFNVSAGNSNKYLQFTRAKFYSAETAGEGGDEDPDTPVLETLANPEITPASQEFNIGESIDVTISAAEGATIYYTTDGETPTESSNVYENALTITETTTVKAIAVMDGYNNSSVAEATYTCVDPNAVENTIVASETGLANATEVGTLKFGNVTATFDAGTNSNATKYYASGTAFRAYGGNTITFTGDAGVTINSVVFTFGSSDGSNAITADCGTYTDGTWTGAANSVKFTIGGSTGNRRIASIKVTYSIEEGVVVIATPSITGEATFIGSTTVEITNNAEGTTLYCSTDGATYNVYENAFTVTETTTVYAYAQDAQGNKSSVAEATFTELEILSIAEAKAAYDAAGESVAVAMDLTGAVVTVKNGQYMFIETDEAAINIYNSGADYAVGTKFTAGYILGQSAAYNKLHQITNAEFNNVETTTAEVVPTEVTVAELNANFDAYESCFIKLTGVDVNGTAIAQGEDAFALYNRFDFITSPATATACDIEGIAARFNTTLQIFPTSFSNTVNVSNVGYATLFLGYPVAIPAGVKVYTVTEVNSSYVTLTQVEGVLPAETGVIVEATADAYDFVYSNETAADVTGNKLLGTTVDTNISVDAYVLSAPNGEAGLYLANMNQNEGAAWKNNANKAYLPASEVPAAAQGAASFSFRFPGTTGIEEITDNRVQSTVIYDLTGRRVENIAAPGIYIVNGVKRVVR